MSIIIQVTKADIDGGKPRNPLLCPVARAYMRQTNSQELAGVFFCGMMIGNDLYELPEEAKQRIKLYDETGFMEPFEFKLGARNENPNYSKKYR